MYCTNMAEEYELQSAISAIKDVVSRIDSLHEPSEIGSIILRLEFINRMLVNLEVPDDVVNTMLRLHEATKRIEARYNSHISAHNGYQASLDRTGRRGRPGFIITAEQLTFLLEQGFTVPVISVMLGVGKRTVERRMSELNLKVSGKYN